MGGTFGILRYMYIISIKILTPLPHPLGSLQQRWKYAGGNRMKKTQHFWLQLGKDLHHL